MSNVDFYYNICVIKIHSPFYLPSKSFSPNIGFVNFYENYSKDVVALGRSCFKARGLRVALGKLIPRRSQFDCEELLVSTCKCSKVSLQQYILQKMPEPLIFAILIWTTFSIDLVLRSLVLCPFITLLRS